MSNCSKLLIDLEAIRCNLRSIERKNVSIMPMVKANGYGTDAALLTHFLESYGVPIVGVSHVDEGVYLREQGITLPIFVISAPPFEAEKVVHYQLEAAISSFEEATALNKVAHHSLVRVHLHINTGMNRFGVHPDKALQLFQYIHSLTSLKLEGIMTHFAAVESPTTNAFTFKQINCFKRVIDQLSPLPRWIHAAKTEMMDLDLPFCNLVRIGLGLFERALTLHSHLVAITFSRKGERVGYEGAYLVERDNIRIGVIPLGYHDGINRHLSGKGYVLIYGKKAAMIGNICMDFMMVDLTQIPEAKVGDPVLIKTECLAKWGNANIREILVCLGPRIKRVFINKKENNESNSERLSKTICNLKKESVAG